MPARRKGKKWPSELKEGEYPSKVPIETPDGDRYVIETTRMVPPSERPVAPIKDALLSEFLLPTFDSMNIRGKSGIGALILLCRMGAHRYETLRLFCIAWEDLHQQNLFQELYPELAFQEPTLEQCCAVAKITNEDFIGDVSRMIYYYGLEAAKWQIQAGLGEVVQAARTSANMIGKEGFQDRQMLMKAGRLIEEGPGTVVNVNNQVTTNQIAGLPKWEDTDKILVETLRPQKQLVEQSVVDAELVVNEQKGELQNAPRE